MDIWGVLTIVIIGLIITFIMWYIKFTDVDGPILFPKNETKLLIGTQNDKRSIRGIRLTSGINIYPEDQSEFTWDIYDNYHIIIGDTLVSTSQILDTYGQEFTDDRNSIIINSEEFRKILYVIAGKEVESY